MQGPLSDENALNMHYVGSGLQAYLETDPAARVTKDEYVMRYQQFARDGLDHALQKYDDLHSSIGVHASFSCHVPSHANSYSSPVPCMSYLPCAESPTTVRNMAAAALLSCMPATQGLMVVQTM